MSYVMMTWAMPTLIWFEAKKLPGLIILSTKKVQPFEVLNSNYWAHHTCLPWPNVIQSLLVVINWGSQQVLSSGMGTLPVSILCHEGQLILIPIPVGFVETGTGTWVLPVIPWDSCIFGYCVNRYLLFHKFWKHTCSGIWETGTCRSYLQYPIPIESPTIN